MNMSNYKLQPLATFLLGAATAIAIILFFLSPQQPPIPNTIIREANGDKINMAPNAYEDVNQTSMSHSTNQEATSQELLQILRRAAMDDNTVIMTVINEAWSAPGSLLDAFLESFRIGEHIERLLKHLIFVAMDRKAYDRCRSFHNLCFFLKVEGVNFTSDKVYMSKDYLKMMWSRNKLQGRILEMGYNFLFTDVDIVWFRNPLRHISVAAHITFASDDFYGNPDDLANIANGGFLYAKSTKNTIEFFKNWYSARERYPGEHDQYVFNQIKYEFSSRFRVTIRFLDAVYCDGLCHPRKHFDKICTFHVTCRAGLASKLCELRNVIEEWKRYKGDQPHETPNNIGHKA
ncbi:uncharacterized protein At4g15970-like [Ananas comosus]|uniref:Uncharacterized protein At4g15970-like n=1 Tax=Ananas comosus TaxID=4615 RepID=A0A6P5EXV4_ANACO|nr:uncharacterized protein At4g15970-like [Ananas comosus]